MAPETLIFMPNGDVTLVLIRHVTKEDGSQSSDSLALPNNSPHDKSSSTNKLTTIDEDGQQEAAPGAEPEAPAEPEDLDDGVLYFAPDPPDGLNGPLYPPTPRAARGSDASSLRDRSASPPASFWASLKRQAARVIDPIEDEQPVTPPSPPKKPEKIIVSSHEVHCVVSSRHLMLASQHFQTLLTGNSKQAATLRASGHVTISLSVDFDTMVILLNIIHGASRKVPRQVSLDVLNKLAILVSSLGMLENVEFFSDTWIDNFQREGLPKAYDGNVLPFLFVFWVFNRPDEFKDMTRLAQRESNEKLFEHVQGIPIPSSIIHAITRDRESAMDASITVIHSLINRYLVGQTVCDGSLDDELRYACDSMILGSLMKSSRKIGVWPRPEEPFVGRTFKDLARAIRSIKILDVCNKTSNRRWNSHGPSSNCHGLEDSIEASMKSIEANLDGLNLSDYAKKGEDLYVDFQSLLHTPLEDDSKDQPTEDTTEISHVNVKGAKKPPQEEVNIPQREKLTETSTRINSRTPEAPVKEPKQTDVVPREYSGESAKPEARAPVRGRTREVEEPVREEAKIISRPYSREFQRPEVRGSPRASIHEVLEPAKEESKASPRPYSREFQQPEVRGSPRASIHEVLEPTKEESKASPRPYSREIQSEARVSPRASVHEIREPVKEESKPNSRPYSREFQQPETQISSRTSAHEIGQPAKEELKANPRDSPTHEVRAPRKSTDELSREDLMSASKEDVRGPGDRKLNRTPSFPKIPREDVRSPVNELQVTPKLASIEEMFEKHSNPVKETVKSSTVETRDSPTTTPTTTDVEETWAPPKNFKIRKSKKTFSTRF